MTELGAGPSGGDAAGTEMRAKVVEATRLRRSGDEKRRAKDLAGARTDYLAALQLHRDVHESVGDGKQPLIPEEAQCLLSLGRAKRLTGDPEGSRADYEAALLIYRQIGARLEATTNARHLDAPNTSDRGAEARDVVGRATNFARLGEAMCLRALGELKLEVGDLDEARTHLEAAVPIFREHGKRHAEMGCLVSLFGLKHKLHDLDGARADGEGALLICRDIGDRKLEARCLMPLGFVKAQMGDLDAARADHEAALPIFRELSDRAGEAGCRTSLGRLKVLGGDLDAARGDYEAALQIYRELSDRAGEAEVLTPLVNLNRRITVRDRARARDEAGPVKVAVWRVVGWLLVRISEWSTRVAFRIARGRVIHGVDVRILMPRTPREDLLKKVETALGLLHDYSPRSLMWLKRYGRILVFVEPWADGKWLQDARIVKLREEYVAQDSTGPVELGATLVHETAHAWLDDHGVEYSRANRRRVEAICTRAQARFAARVPGNGELAGRYADLADGIRRGSLGDWSDEAFRGRDIDAAQRLGIPRWMMRVIGFRDYELMPTEEEPKEEGGP